VYIKNCMDALEERLDSRLTDNLINPPMRAEPPPLWISLYTVVLCGAAAHGPCVLVAALHSGSRTGR
jgi:hypothetical protein